MSRSSVIIIGIMCLIIIVAFVCIFIQSRRNAKIGKIVDRLTASLDNAEMMFQKEKENEERKKKLHTGNTADDVGNSINILYDLSARR